MAERPAIERGIPVVKIISVVAPLAGLLRNSYRYDCNVPTDYTLFGTGDPKIMAGGISQALVTTVSRAWLLLSQQHFYTLLRIHLQEELLMFLKNKAQE